MKKLLLLLFLIPNLVIGESHTCNCNEINCIEASEELNSDGSYNLVKMTRSIKGILASKNAIHPARGNFISPILIFKYPECIFGAFYNPLGEREEIAPTNMDNIQLSLDKKEMDFYKKNKGSKVVVTGYFSRSYNANHTTHPFFFIVENIGETK